MVDWIEHQKTNESSPKSPFKCNDCGECFLEIENLVKHVAFCNPKSPSTKKSKDKKLEGQISEESKDETKNKENVSKDSPTEDISQNSKEESTMSTIEKVKSGIWSCELCGFESTKNKPEDRITHLALQHYRDRMKDYLRVYLTSDKFNCSLCEFVGVDKHSLYLHFSERHKAEIVEQYLSEDITTGGVETWAQIQANTIQQYLKGTDSWFSERPCELCGFKGGYKTSGFIKRQHHLYHMHYKAKIDADLKDIIDFTCPLCPYIGKSHWLLNDHYICTHRVVEKYLSEDIAAGRVETILDLQKQAKEATDSVQQNIVDFTPATTSVDLPSVTQPKTLASATSKTVLSPNTDSLKHHDVLDNSERVRYFYVITNLQNYIQLFNVFHKYFLM